MSRITFFFETMFKTKLNSEMRTGQCSPTGVPRKNSNVNTLFKKKKKKKTDLRL